MVGPVLQNPAANSYYRRTEIASDGAIKLLPALTDAALAKTPQFKLEGGPKANLFLLSGTVPDTSHYGGGTLVGGNLVLYCSGVNTSTSGAPPSISVFNAVSGSTFTEGAMELSNGWEVLTGTSGSNGAGGTTITGTGTTFKEDFSPGDEIKISDDIATVSAIASDTSMTVSAITAANTNQPLYKPRFYGDELAVYTAHADKDITTYSEYFDGDTSLGQIKIPGYKASNPYIDLNSTDASILTSKLYAGGNYSITYDVWAKIDDSTPVHEGTKFFSQYFGTNKEGTRETLRRTATPTDISTIARGAADSLDNIVSKLRGTTSSAPITPNKSHLFLKPYDVDKPQDLWVPKYDFRSGVENIVAFTPMWRWKDIRQHVKYLDYEKTEVEENEDVTPNNTIFDAGLIFATPDLSTYYGAGDATGVPVNKSIIQLSTDTYDDGGQSLNMYHLWSYSEMMGKIDTQYGTTGSANAQYSCVGMANVPYPQVIDHAWSAYKGNMSPAAYPHSLNVALPEINVKFNIKEMDFVPEIHSSKGSSPTSEYGIFTDYMYGNLGAADNSNSYAEDVDVKGFTSGSYMETLRTLMRNFTICFSNYPPNEGESLDDFIHRGMKGFYSGALATAGAYNQKKTFIGGMTVFRSEPKVSDIDMYSSASTEFEMGNGSAVIAMPLQTGVSSYAMPIADTHTTGTALHDGEVRNRLLRFMNASGNSSPSANVMCFAGAPARRGDEASTGHQVGGVGQPGGYFEESVPLQMDQFVNVKFVFDPLGFNYATTGTEANSYGVQNLCRAYFTEGVYSSNDGDNAALIPTDMDEAGTAGGIITDDTPSIPIYFPTTMSAPEASSTGRRVESWVNSPHYWPRYMTIWVTNYRQTNNTSTTTDTLKGETQPWSQYSSNMCEFGFGIEESADGVGSDKQTNVFIDTITFSNFTNNVANASAKAAGATNNIILNQYKMETSSITPENASTPPYNWKISQQLGSTLSTKYMPTYLLMGYTNGPSDFYNSGSNGVVGTTQYYQLHGFGNANRANLTRQGTGSTQAFWTRGDSSHVTTPAEKAFKYYGNYLYRYKMLSGAYDNNPVEPSAIVDADGVSSSVYAGRITVDYNASSLPTNSTSSPGEFNFASGSNSKLWTDGLTQKGFFLFGSTGAIGDSSPNFNDGWVKREHPFVSSKVTKIPIEVDGGPNTGNSFEVDNVAIFDMPLDEEYILYKVAGVDAWTDNAWTDSGSSGMVWDYNTIALSNLAPDATIAADDTVIDLTTADAATKYAASYVAGRVPTYLASNMRELAAGGYLYTGAYLALISSSAVKEIVRIEEYIYKGESSTKDKMIVRRGCMGTSAATRTSADHTFELVIPIAAKGVKMKKAREGNIITLDDPDVSSLITESNLPYLYISPYKYWHWLQVYPGASLGNTSMDFHATVGTDSSAKAYTGISLMKDVSATTTSTGSTYSENMYTWQSDMTGTANIGLSAPYYHTWNLSPESTGSYIESNVDFGHGAFDPETREGGATAIQNALPNTPIAFNLDGYVQSINPSPSAPIVNKINLTAPLASSSAVFFGNDYTTTTATSGVLSGTSVVQEDVKPYYLWRYFDPLPTVSDFQVNPAFNLLDRETDLYSLTNEDLTAVRFTWNESGEDIWYRMLIVDNGTIYSKYHGLAGPTGPLMYAALNDVPASMTSAPALTFEETTLDSLGTTFNPTVASKGRMSPVGLAGYAYDCGVSGGAGITINATSQCKMMQGSEDWTFVAHCIPSAERTGGNRTIFKLNDSAAPFNLYLDGSGYCYATFGNGAALMSRTKNPLDGKTPLMVAVQFGKNSKIPRKLFINGALEDYSLTGTTAMSATPVNGYIGTDDATSESAPFKGLIEEVIIYGTSHIFFPDKAGEYILPSELNAEFSSTEIMTTSARLFIMDYTNIRGKTNDAICSTPTVDWRVTAA